MSKDSKPKPVCFKSVPVIKRTSVASTFGLRRLRVLDLRRTAQLDCEALAHQAESNRRTAERHDAELERAHL